MRQCRFLSPPALVSLCIDILLQVFIQVHHESVTPDSVFGEEWFSYLHYCVTMAWFQFYERFRLPTKMKAIAVLAADLKSMTNSFCYTDDPTWMNRIFLFPIKTNLGVLHFGLLHEQNFHCLPKCHHLRQELFSLLLTLQENDSSDADADFSSFSLFNFPLLFFSGGCKKHWELSPLSTTSPHSSSMTIVRKPDTTSSFSSSPSSPSSSSAQCLLLNAENSAAFAHYRRDFSGENGSAWYVLWPSVPIYLQFINYAPIFLHLNQSEVISFFVFSSAYFPFTFLCLVCFQSQNKTYRRATRCEMEPID